MGDDNAENQMEQGRIVEVFLLQIGFQVYALSKLFMQNLIHGVLMKHLNPRKWKILASDTDSVAVELADGTLDECVKRTVGMH